MNSMRTRGTRSDEADIQEAMRSGAAADWLTRGELAAELKVAVRTVDSWRKNRRISTLKIGRIIRFRRSQVLLDLSRFERKAITG